MTTGNLIFSLYQQSPLKSSYLWFISCDKKVLLTQRSTWRLFMELFGSRLWINFASPNNWESPLRRQELFLACILQPTNRKNIYWFAKFLCFLDSTCVNNIGTIQKLGIPPGYFLPADGQTPPRVIQPDILQAYSEDNQAHWGKKRQLTDSGRMIRFPKTIPVM